MIKFRIFIIFILLLLLVASGGALVTTLTGTSTPTPTPTITATPTPTPQPTATPTLTYPSFSEVVAKVSPSVVYIFVDYIEVDIFGRRYNANKSGSGVIMRPDGYILTNRHVVEDFSRVEVTLPNLEVHEATGVWLDPLLDLAVVKIEGQDFPTASFGDASQLQVGDWIVAIGHPLGLSPEEGGSTVTAGIISNLGRSFWIEETPYYDVIQTDAAINPGNSGGPLVNLGGEVIGINSAISGEAQNIGYAIGADTARTVFEDLVEYGQVHRPYLGVEMQTVTPAVASKYDLFRNRGVRISHVEPDTPAAREGLEINDVITHLGDREVTEATELINMLWWQYEVGDRVKITFWRGEEEQEVWVTLAERSEGL